MESELESHVRPAALAASIGWHSLGTILDNKNGMTPRSDWH
ncbi:hypothetical protein [Granulicella tundricola]|uniref:Uncharacterized protein n=1 Tax=Granulicella tundricola (strain ATCC BAA-1859 / DSM 23138 / MP5ACTX9) TaxID=1198114 RepID=E8X3R4_GRATM|nr:hypothetical protein [Granulicella tundricola]ADW69342.1 hypothetical protein AciX9_2305 [Granulicella tundricola MP5ACTX9]